MRTFLILGLTALLGWGVLRKQHEVPASRAAALGTGKVLAAKEMPRGEARNASPGLSRASASIVAPEAPDAHEIHHEYLNSRQADEDEAELKVSPDASGVLAQTQYRREELPPGVRRARRHELWSEKGTLIHFKKGVHEVPNAKLKTDCKAVQEVTSLIALTISVTGKVTDARVLEEGGKSPPAAIFDCRFDPYRIDGEAVPVATIYAPAGAELTF